MPEQSFSSFVSYLGDGSTTTFSIPFDYLSEDHIRVSIEGEEKEDGWTIEDGEVTFDEAPSDGDAVRIRRQTPDERIVDFQGPSTLTERDLDTSAKQSMFIAQEARDEVDASMGIDEAENWDADGRRLRNLADGETSSDAATVGQFDEWTEAVSNYADDAASSASDAQSSASDAASSASDAEQAKNAAQEARDDAEGYAEDASDAVEDELMDLGLYPEEGDEGKVLRVNEAEDEYDLVYPAVDPSKIAIVQHREDSGDSGGDTSANSWVYRPLNAVLKDADFISFYTEQGSFELSPGRYLIRFWGCLFIERGGRCALFDMDSDEPLTDDEGNRMVGKTVRNGGSPLNTFISEGEGIITVSEGTTIDVVHANWSADTDTRGLGSATESDGDYEEVFASIAILKLN